MRKLLVIFIMILSLAMTGCSEPKTSSPASTPPSQTQQIQEQQPEVITSQTPVQPEEATSQTPAQPEKTASASKEQVQKEEVNVYITKTGAKYHLAGCSSLAKSQIPISLSDAKDGGYGPCKNCKPPS